MIPVVFVFFTILALARRTLIHFWLFDKVKLRDVGTGEDAFTDFALGKLHQRLQVLDEFVHALLVVIECLRVLLATLGDEGQVTLLLLPLLLVELFLLLFESPLVYDQWLQVRTALDDADVVERCEA